MLEACGSECHTPTRFSPSRPAILFSERVKLQRIMGEDLRNREFLDSQPPDVGSTSAGIDGYGRRESRAWCWLGGRGRGRDGVGSWQGRAGQGRNDGGGGEYALACCGYLHTVSYALQQGEQGSKNKAIIVRPATLSESGLQVKVFGMQ